MKTWRYNEMIDNIKFEKIMQYLTKDVGKKYTVFVKHRPPVKGNSTKDNKERRIVLKEEARKQLGFSKPKGNNVRLKIQYYNKDGNDDVLNVEGGIADALEGVAYDNDNQIRNSSIDEYFVTKDPNWYKIELEFLEFWRSSYDGEFGKQFPN